MRNLKYIVLLSIIATTGFVCSCISTPVTPAQESSLLKSSPSPHGGVTYVRDGIDLTETHIRNKDNPLLQGSFSEHRSITPTSSVSSISSTSAEDIVGYSKKIAKLKAAKFLPLKINFKNLKIRFTKAEKNFNAAQNPIIRKQIISVQNFLIVIENEIKETAKCFRILPSSTVILLPNKIKELEEIFCDDPNTSILASDIDDFMVVERYLSLLSAHLQAKISIAEARLVFIEAFIISAEN